MAYVNWRDLIEATDKGLDIIRLVYPDVDAALESRDHKFKARAEKTASASLRLKDGHYHVTDFGDDQKERNSIGVYMKSTGKEFAEAVQYLAEYFKIPGSDSAWQQIRPTIETRPIKATEKAKDFSIETKDFTEDELTLLGPAVSAKHCADYKLVSIKSFTYCKENEVTITGSNESYPIYGFDYGDWVKLYQPMSYDKAFRFRFLGKKPKRFIYGMDLVKKQFNTNKENQLEEEITYDEENAPKETKKKDPRIDYVFIVSGGSDGLNLRSFGYFPIWFNSESETPSFEEYKLLQTYAKEIVYIADLDTTGLKMANQISLKYLDIKVMLLPEYLKLKKDRRGNACKDFKDFVVNYYTKKDSVVFNARLRKLIDNALPAQFWTEAYTKSGKKFYFRHTQFYNFLKLNGFGRIKDEHTKDGFHFVHVDGNVVRKVLPVEIEAFVHQFLKDKQLPVELRDLIYSKQLSENALKKLDPFNIEFKSSQKNAQYMFFDNAVLQVTADNIELKRRGDVDLFIWENKMFEHAIHLEEPHFKIKEDVHGNDDIDIMRYDNEFLCYLINSSRVHWRKELEENLSKLPPAEAAKYKHQHKFSIAGPNLTDNERYEQKLHLINKIYALGYMLHTYKSPQKPWALYAMDNKLADISESHGGSGKSVFLKGIQHILKQNHYINGRDKKKTQDDFIFHGVTAETDYIMVDDCHMHMDYGFFFNVITGDLEVNNKNGIRFVIPFDKVGKIAFASNFPPNNLDPSLARRLLYVVYSDYYHFNQDEEYNESRAVSDDFDGRNLFKDWDDKKWNSFYNFCAEAVQLYLSSTRKLDPPMDNVTMRNLMSEMGAAFKDWADVFFAQKGPQNHFLHLDQFVVKETAFKDLKDSTGFKYSPTKFKRSLKAYAKFNEWIFNPEGSSLDANDRIMQKIDGQTKEVFFIKTTAPKKTEAIAASAEPNEETTDSLKEDLPF